MRIDFKIEKATILNKNGDVLKKNRTHYTSRLLRSATIPYSFSRFYPSNFVLPSTRARESLEGEAPLAVGGPVRHWALCSPPCPLYPSCTIPFNDGCIILMNRRAGACVGLFAFLLFCPLPFGAFCVLEGCFFFCSLLPFSPGYRQPAFSTFVYPSAL